MSFVFVVPVEQQQKQLVQKDPLRIKLTSVTLCGWERPVKTHWEKKELVPKLSWGDAVSVARRMGIV